MNQLYESIKNIFVELNTPESNSRIEMENCGRTCTMSHKLQEEALKVLSEMKDKGNLNLLFTAYKKVYNNPRLYKEGNIIYLELFKVL